jgi:hypothetical protein
VGIELVAAAFIPNRYFRRSFPLSMIQVVVGSGTPLLPLGFASVRHRQVQWTPRPIQAKHEP